MHALICLGYFFILLVSVLIGWSWYVMVFLAWGPKLVAGEGEAFGAVLVLLVFHLLLGPLCVSYARCFLTNPGSVPNSWKMAQREILERSEAEGESAADDGDRLETKRDGRIRYCRKCDSPKPDRSHHCSVCRRCVLKMDHHCPWINNCVGFYNQKFFVLFLFYTGLETIFVTCVNLPQFIACFSSVTVLVRDCRYQVLFNLFIVGSLAISMLFFASYHFYLVLSGSTTIERFEKERHPENSRTFNLSYRENFESVMGPNKWLWFLPVANIQGDGINFSSRLSPQLLTDDGIV